MDPLTSLRISWRNITDHKLRSTLTTLGVIIGVGAVITFVILGASLQADIVQTIAGETTDIAYVTANSGDQTQVPQLSGGGGQPVFTEHDVGLVRNVDGVKWAIPEGGVAASNVQFRDDFVGRQFVTVTTPAYFEARGIQFQAGRPFRLGEREVVLNERATRMFDPNVSVGNTITIVRAATGEEINATVVGVVEAPENGGQTGFVGDSRPAIYAPTRPVYERRAVSPTQGQQQLVYPRIIVVVEDVQEMQAVKGRLQTTLAEEGDARILAPQGYEVEVTTYDQLVDRIEQISDTFTAYIAGVALISLIVGAIGIANIMLVSVTERRREIGIMKAIGAERGDVLQLFLNEAVILGIIGALIGAVVGLTTGWAATRLLELPFRARAGWFAAAIVVGVLIGVLSGIYPAWSAARVDPIDALRYE
jgi:putative ABC transport system permease protein